MKCKDIQVSLANGGAHIEHLLDCADCRRFVDDLDRIERQRESLQTYPTEELRHRIREKLSHPRGRSHVAGWAIASALVMLIVGPTVPLAFRRLSGHEVRGESLGNFRPYHCTNYTKGTGGSGDYELFNWECWSNGRALRIKRSHQDDILWVENNVAWGYSSVDYKLKKTPLRLGPNAMKPQFLRAMATLYSPESVPGGKIILTRLPTRINVFGRSALVCCEVYKLPHLRSQHQEGFVLPIMVDLYREIGSGRVVRRVEYWDTPAKYNQRSVWDFDDKVPTADKFDPYNLAETETTSIPATPAPLK